MAIFGAKLATPAGNNLTQAWEASLGLPQPGEGVLPPQPAPASMPQVMPFEPPKRSFLDRLGLVADAFTGTNQNGMQLQAQEQEAYNRWLLQNRELQRQAAEQREQSAPRFFQAPGGDYVRFDPTTNKAEVVYDAPDKAPAPTALEQQVNLLRRLRPGMTDAQAAEVVQRGIIGGQYDPNVYRPMVDYKAEAARVTKATPTYAQTHPKASSGGGGRGGGKPSATRVVGGKAYYKINGRWYDNSEGR